MESHNLNGIVKIVSIKKCQRQRDIDSFTLHWDEKVFNFPLSQVLHHISEIINSCTEVSV